MRMYGISQCGVDLTMAGRYNVNFSLVASSGLAAWAARQIVVQAVCVSGEAPCQDGSCSSGACRFHRHGSTYYLGSRWGYACSRHDTVMQPRLLPVKQGTG